MSGALLKPILRDICEMGKSRSASASAHSDLALHCSQISQDSKAVVT